MAVSKTITMADIERCPHRSLSPTHYRDDGSCACRTETGQLTALVVTTQMGEHPQASRRRYVVVDSYELFADVLDGRVPEAEGTPALGPDGPGTGWRPPSVNDIHLARERHLGGRFSFGGRWLRSLGKVDEMYHTISTYEVVKVERLPYERVWGDGR